MATITIQQQLLTSLRKQNGAFGEAVHRAIEDIAAQGEDTLADIWRTFGPRILRWLDREDRLRSIARDVSAALRIAVPVGNSGQRKTLQKLTKTDVLTIAAIRDRAAQTQAEHAKLLRKLASQVGDKTVGDIWTDITVQQRRQILEALGIRVAMPAAVGTAA